MSKLIAYKNTKSGVSIIYPVISCGLTIKEIAEKDTPSGSPYFFIENESEIESIDWSKPDGTGLGAELFFSIQANAEQAKAEISAQIESKE